MEEETSVRLQAEVERIVRPVRAVYNTRLKMREELYAHLSGLYREERARASNEEGAVQSALARLGDLAELRCRLQGTVGAFEQLNWCLNLEFLPFLKRTGFRKPGETDLHRAVRVATIQTAISIIAYGIIAGAISGLRSAFPGTPADVPHPVLSGLWIAAANGGIFFALHVLGPHLTDRIADIGGRNLRWYALMAAGGLFTLCCGFGIMASMAIVIDGSTDLRLKLGGLFIVVSVLTGRMLGCQFHSHRCEEWLSLPLPKQ